MDSIKYKDEVHKVCEISWISGSLSIAGALIKTDSALTDVLVMLLLTGMLKLDLCPRLETKSSTKTLGCKEVHIGVISQVVFVDAVGNLCARTKLPLIVF